MLESLVDVENHPPEPLPANLPKPSALNNTDQSIAETLRQSEVLNIAHTFLYDPLLSQWANKQPTNEKVMSFGFQEKLQESQPLTKLSRFAP